jgi:hypothetical protein
MAGVGRRGTTTYAHWSRSQALHQSRRWLCPRLPSPKRVLPTWSKLPFHRIVIIGSFGSDTCSSAFLASAAQSFFFHQALIGTRQIPRSRGRVRHETARLSDPLYMLAKGLIAMRRTYVRTGEVQATLDAMGCESPMKCAVECRGVGSQEQIPMQVTGEHPNNPILTYHYWKMLKRQYAKGYSTSSNCLVKRVARYGNPQAFACCKLPCQVHSFVGLHNSLFDERVMRSGTVNCVASPHLTALRQILCTCASVELNIYPWTPRTYSTTRSGSGRLGSKIPRAYLPYFVTLSGHVPRFSYLDLLIFDI